MNTKRHALAIALLAPAAAIAAVIAISTAMGDAPTEHDRCEVTAVAVEGSKRGKGYTRVETSCGAFAAVGGEVPFTPGSFYRITSTNPTGLYGDLPLVRDAKQVP